MSSVVAIMTQRSRVVIVEASFPSFGSLYLDDMVNLGGYTPAYGAFISIITESLLRKHTPGRTVIETHVLRIARLIVVPVILALGRLESLGFFSVNYRQTRAAIRCPIGDQVAAPPTCF